MLSRKHYKMIAKAIKDSIIKTNDNIHINKASLINDLNEIFYRDNNNYDDRRFIEACND